jgi:hypothetical protein
MSTNPSLHWQTPLIQVELSLLKHRLQYLALTARPSQTHCMPMTEYPGLQTQALPFQTELATEAHWLTAMALHLDPSKKVPLGQKQPTLV